MKCIPNLILFLLVINIYGQENNAEYLELKTKLLNSDSELVIEFNTICFGGVNITPDDSENCTYEKPFYLFWTKNGQYFKRKFSNCKLFPEIEMEKSEFIEKVKTNLFEIQNSEILPVIHEINNSNGKSEIIELEFNHYCESKFIINTKKEQIIKSIIDYQLTTELIDKNTPNDNYSKNQSSILNAIYKLAQKETD
ncbi:hypothetical protein [Mesoflavibacter zeaxanthinifaciens]|uniref:hypothetical protein n=1 Tax=Mesoflavibacter zeaxanthinifaciens TaxID=393060 RepID=UPI003A92462C